MEWLCLLLKRLCLLVERFVLYNYNDLGVFILVFSLLCVGDFIVPSFNWVKVMNTLLQDISRCLLWTQRHHQTWPQIRTDVLSKPIDLLMLNRLKESFCEIKVSSSSYPTHIQIANRSTQLRYFDACLLIINQRGVHANKWTNSYQLFTCSSHLYWDYLHV